MVGSLSAVRLSCGDHSPLAALPHVALKVEEFVFQEESSQWTLESASEAGFTRLLDRLLLYEWPGFNQSCREERLKAAVGKGYAVPVLQWWLKSYIPEQTVLSLSDICRVAIENGQLHVLQWLLQGQGQLLINRLMRCNSPEIAYWLYDHGHHLTIAIKVQADASVGFIKWCLAVEDDRDCSFTVEWPSIQDVVKCGHLEIIKRLREYQPKRHLLELALRFGHISLAMWLSQSQPMHYFPDLRCHLFDWKRLDVEVIQWVLYGFEWKDTKAQLVCLKNMAALAATKGDLDMLKFIFKILSIEATPIDVFQNVNAGSNCLDFASANGHLAVVRWLHEQRQQCTPKAMDEAAKNGHLEVIQWLHHNRTEGCTTGAMDNAAKKGHLEIVLWLHENRTEGCTMRAMDYAASRGHLDIVKWLHENRTEGCAFLAMDEAAKEGHHEVVQWLHKNRHEGCTGFAQQGAAFRGHVTIFKWFHENRLERCSQETFAAEVDYSPGHLDVLEYAARHPEYVSIGVAVDTLIYHGRFGAVESILREAQAKELPAAADSKYVDI